jgi:hypothetical protein
MVNRHFLLVSPLNPSRSEPHQSPGLWTDLASDIIPSGDSMILLLREPAGHTQIQEMLQEYERLIKIVVDIRRRILSGGGEMHSDCEEVLLEDGSEQDDLWGANWYPAEQRIEFEALINIRPRLGNRNILIQDEALRRLVETITREILGGAQ